MRVRRAAATLALAALALGAAGAARATPEDDVRTVAVAFLEATARQDGPALCGTMTAELQARVGGGRNVSRRWRPSAARSSPSTTSGRAAG